MIDIAGSLKVKAFLVTAYLQKVFDSAYQSLFCFCFIFLFQKCMILVKVHKMDENITYYLSTKNPVLSVVAKPQGN